MAHVLSAIFTAFSRFALDYRFQSANRPLLHTIISLQREFRSNIEVNNWEVFIFSVMCQCGRSCGKVSLLRQNAFYMIPTTSNVALWVEVTLNSFLLSWSVSAVFHVFPWGLRSVQRFDNKFCLSLCGELSCFVNWTQQSSPLNSHFNCSHKITVYNRYVLPCWL